MFDFEEELKKYKPSLDADMAVLELSGDEPADMKTVLKMVMRSESSARSRKLYDQIELEDFK